MPNLGSLFSGIAQGYAQGVHQQRQDALAKQAQEQQAAYQQAQIKMAGAQAVLNNPNATAEQKQAAQATIQDAISQIGQTGQGQGGRGKGGKKGGSADQENPLAKIFALLQGHQGGGQTPPTPAPPPAQTSASASTSTSASAPQASAPPATPPIPAPSAAAQNGGGGGGAPATPPVPQPGYLSGPGGLDRQRAQAEFDQQQAQAQAAVALRTQQADKVGLVGSARQDYILSGKLPSNYGSAVLHPVGRPMPAENVPPNAVNLDGTPFNPASVPAGTPVQLTETSDGSLLATVVAAPQQSPNSALGQLTQAFRTLQTADPASPEARAAADVVAKADPSRVRVTSTERTITITNPDGSTQVVTIPITSTSATAPGSGSGSPKLPPLPSAGAGAASPVSGTGGHKALPAQEARQVESAANLITMAEAVKAAIAQAGEGADDNSIMTAIKNRLKSAQYRAGFAVDTNKISNFSGLMQAMVASTVGTGRLNQRLLDIAEQHVPATGMTPAAMLERISNMEEAARDVRQGVLSTRGLALGPDGRLVNAPSQPSKSGGKTGDPAVDRLLQQMGIGSGAGGGGGA